LVEIELKFELAPGAHAALGRDPALAGAKPRTVRLQASYFDTPDFELRRREMALRLRRGGRRWFQTLKSGRSGAAGLHSRDEWEFERREPTIDLQLLEGTPFDDLGLAPEALREIFTVDVRRTTWEVEVAPGNRVEVALDRGEVRHGVRAEAVCELEIESVSGDPMAVFELADRLMPPGAPDGDAPARLKPSAVTKAQRGYGLARSEPAQPMRAVRANLDASMTTAEAARSVASAALAQLQGNEAGAIAGDDPEYLHQFRVALRRLRSALGVFREAAGPEAEALREELRWIGGLTGPARDWDVFATSTLPTLLEAFGNEKVARSLQSRAASRRAAASSVLREALLSTRWARLLLALARWLAQPPAAPAASAESLSEFARRIVRKRQKRLLRDAARLSALTPAERHALRLDAKRLRYALEGLAPLFKARRVEAHLDALSEVQDDLGRANDAAVAARLLSQLRPPAPFGEFARGWFAAQEHASAAGLERHAALLAGVPKLRLKAEGQRRRALPASNELVEA
jgi:inorganic triphosphatase YgiF